MKRLNFALLLTVLAILLASISSIFSNAISLPTSVKNFALPLFGLCIVFMILFAVMQQIQGQKSQPPSNSYESLKASDLLRSKMLQLIERSWIRDYLEPSLFTKKPLPIKVMYQPTAVNNSNKLPVVSAPQDSSLSLQNLYDLSLDGLLILGKAGAGKTIALLGITRVLLDHAHNDDKQPIPVIFSLSSWDVKQAPLHEWMIQELQVRYKVSQQLAQFWIDTEQIIPLLDDFDMVGDTCRAACIQAINSYQQQHGLIPLVVCSRTKEYFAQTTRFHFRNAVMLQPLSTALIATYIAEGNQKLKTIRIILRKYPQLLSYARLPRFLDMLARYIAKQSSSTQGYRSLLQNTNSQHIEQELLTGYVQQQMQQIPNSMNVTDLQIGQTLHWLADSIKTHHQTSFALEELQPDWLPDEQLRHEAQRGVRTQLMLLYLVVGQLNGVLLSQSGKIPFMTISFILSQITCYQFLRIAKNATFVQKPDLDASLIETITWAWKHKRQPFLKSVFRLGCTYLLMIVVCGVIAGIFMSLWKGWTFGLLAGFLLSLFAFIVILASSSARALRIGLVRHRPRQPGDGIWRTARHGMLYSLLPGAGVGIFAFGIIQIMQFGLQFPEGFALAMGFTSGLNIWLLCSLMNGGYTLIQHYEIRLLLKKAGYTPGKLTALLNVAVQCRLLRLINSSFMFPNRRLLDYFASSVPSEDTQSADSSESS